MDEKYVRLPYSFESRHPFNPLFFALERNSRLENVIAKEREEKERELRNRSSVVISVKFSRPTFPPTNRSGGQVDGKERHRITRLILPFLLLFARCLHRLLLLLSPPGFSAFSAIAVVTTSCHLGRLSSPIPRSWILLVRLHTLRLLSPPPG